MAKTTGNYFQTRILVVFINADLEKLELEDSYENKWERACIKLSSIVAWRENSDQDGEAKGKITVNLESGDEFVIDERFSNFSEMMRQNSIITGRLLG